MILTRHEQGATHAADAYARVTGKVGVVIVTSGPGAANTVTGIANAYMDSVPLVVITGQVATHVLGTDAFQETDITGITIPITKHNYLLDDPADVPEVMAEAFHIASTGRPGPVLIDLPVDISRGEIMFKYPERVNLPGYKPTVKGHAKQIKDAATLISKARKPLLYVGGGVLSSNAAKELKELAELMQLPVVTTLMGKGAFPEDHHLFVGMPGMHGGKFTNYAITETDLLFGIGVRFDDRVTGKLATFATKAKIIHADIDPAEIGKNRSVDLPIVGDAKAILTGIIAELRKMNAEPHTEAWMRVIDDWRTRFPFHYHTHEDVIMPQQVVERVRELTKDRPTVYCTEVGQNQMWACQYLKIREPRTWASSGGLGTMGFGLPAAIGAQLGRPDHLVVDIAGDGSIQMNSQELATAAINKLPGEGGHPQQRLPRHGAPVAGALLRASLLELDAAAGLPRLREARRGLRRASASGPRSPRSSMPRSRRRSTYDGPAIVDVRVEREENVFPMVAPGGSIDEMLGGIPGGPVSEMLDDEALEEVWE